MSVMFISLISILIATYLLNNIFKLKGFVSVSLSSFLFVSIQIILIGFIASYFKELANTYFWTFGSIFILILVSISAYISNDKLFMTNNKSILNRVSFIYSTIGTWWKEESNYFQKTILLILLSTFFFTTITNLIIIFNVAPHNWDSMTYHLAQIPYFLQQNSLVHFGADYWAQDVHPKNASLLKIYMYLVTNRSENLMQLVQFFSYIISGISIYGISRLIGGDKFQSIIAALIFSLLTESLMESITTQNDMVITALTGVIIYFMLLWGKSLAWKYLLLTGLAVGFSLGVKSSFLLVLPSVAIIFLYLLYIANQTKVQKLQSFILISVFSILSIIILALPSGYIENIQDYGHPIGPKHVRSGHSFEGKSFEYIMDNGSKNILRFGFDFLSLDGLPPKQVFNLTQKSIQKIPKELLSVFNINIEGKKGCRVPYRYANQTSMAHEDSSSWGLFGFTLIFLSIFLSLIGFIKSKFIRVFSVATVIFILVQSFVGPYDPWRGRYFLIATIFAVPTLIGLLNIKNKFLNSYLLIVILLGAFSALSSVMLRNHSSIIDFEHQKSIFDMNRLEQLTRNGKCFNTVFNTYEKNVPKTATVATILGGDQFEYPLFGEYLTRTILPLNPSGGKLKPIPLNAEYLYFDSYIYSDINTTTDVFLGCKTLYLRKIKHRDQ